MSTISDPRDMIFPARGPLAPVAPPPEAGTAAGLGPADLLRIVKQHKILIAVTFTLLFALAVAGTLVTRRYFPQFTATGLVQVFPPRMGDPMGLGQEIAPPDQLRALLETEAKKIKRLTLLGKVLEQPEVQRTEFFRWYEGKVEQRLDDLDKLVAVSPIPDTQLIRISLGVRNAEDAVTIVNTLMRLYTQEYGGAEQRRNQQQLEGYKGTRDRIINDLKIKTEELAEIRRQKDVSQFQSQREVVNQHVGDLMAVRSSLLLEAAQAQAQKEQIEGLNLNSLPINAEMKLIIENDPVLRFIRQNVEAIDIELAAQSKVFGPQHRQIQLLQQRRQGYYDQEVQKREELIDDLRRRYKESLDQSVAAINSRQMQIQDELDQALAQQRDLDSSIETYQGKLRDEESLRRQLDDIDNRIRAAEHSMIDKSNVRVQVAQEAIRPVEPSRPDVFLWIAGGFAVALLGALGIAFLWELSDTAIRTPLDVMRHGHLSVLGVVPTLDAEEADVDAIEVATRLAPQSLVSESFRQIRTTLLYSGPSDSQRSLLITSPRPEDGKTAVAMNLAVTLARGNQRVLLIDANFRRPAIRPAFQNTRPEGLSDALTGHARWADLVSASEVPNLDILSSGRLPPSPGELLASVTMRDLLADAVKKYDRVIIDGPPVLMISDALILSTQVDAVILVARAANSSRGALRRAHEVLQRVNARVVGCVLNGATARPGGYFREQYREFYEYTSDETMPFELPAQATGALPSGKESGELEDEEPTKT